MLNLVQHLTEYLSFKSKILKRQSPQVKQVVLCNSGTMRSMGEGGNSSPARGGGPCEAWWRGALVILTVWRGDTPNAPLPSTGLGWGCRAGAAFDGQTPPLRRCAAPPLP
jgi:hypothetical protein